MLGAIGERLWGVVGPIHDVGRENLAERFRVFLEIGQRVNIRKHTPDINLTRFHVEPARELPATNVWDFCLTVKRHETMVGKLKGLALIGVPIGRWSVKPDIKTALNFPGIVFPQIYEIGSEFEFVARLLKYAKAKYVHFCTHSFLLHLDSELAKNSLCVDLRCLSRIASRNPFETSERYIERIYYDKNESQNRNYGAGVIRVLNEAPSTRHQTPNATEHVNHRFEWIVWLPAVFLGIGVSFYGLCLLYLSFGDSGSGVMLLKGIGFLVSGWIIAAFSLFHSITWTVN
jgi:hypothetical protein